jgi:cation:H+ antiporter
MVLNILLLLLGLGIVSAGADILVRAGSALAHNLGLTPMVIGLTVVAFGTSTPEMVVSVGGSLQGQDGVAIGNVIGSNIFNIGLILGLCALIHPLDIKLGFLKKDGAVMVLLSLGAVCLLSLPVVSRLMGAILLLCLAGYTTWCIHMGRKEVVQDIPPGPARQAFSVKNVVIQISLVILGLVVLVGGSHLFIGKAMTIARAFNVSETVIGLTIVAAGTSMPELATSIVAVIKKKYDVAAGNVIGSNIFNLLGILGLSALVKPLNPEGIISLDLWVMLAFAAGCLPLLWTGLKLQRIEGTLLVGSYVAYTWMRWP